jgi:ribosomal peptide maturation radical SAM protein 1
VDALIVVPPFAGLDRPSLAAHILQACAAVQRLHVDVLYANLLLAAEIGEESYSAICYAPCSGLLGERFFARTAYDTPPLGRPPFAETAHFHRLASGGDAALDEARLRALEEIAPAWTQRVARMIAERSPPVVGCSTTFEQTAASVAILNEVKRLVPSVVTVLGGANCEGEMAEGLRSLRASVDFIFSGESEATFPAFLAMARDGGFPTAPVIAGTPCMRLDDLPTPTFEQYYEQLADVLPRSSLAETGAVWLPYESSRGCWWGQKQHCTFCGLNALGMTYRRKSPDRVLTELGTLLEKHPSRQVCMVDNIMPYEYFTTVVPRLARELPDAQIFYEQKANLSLTKVVALVAAGIRVIQPGIEALSTRLLRLMRKGVTATQNVALLRYARSADLFLNWNLLYAFPGDSAEDYEETLRLLPLIRHLMPPGGFYHLSIDRFSPYFDQPEQFGVSDIRALEGYSSILPEYADAERIAYHFTASYTSGILARPDLIARIQAEVTRWLDCWQSTSDAPPALAVEELAEDLYLLYDTRGLPETEEINFLTRTEARAALGGVQRGEDSLAAWGSTMKVLATIDGRLVPLATASPDVLARFEAEASSERHRLPALLGVPADY